jgi:hypothetical protein
MRTSFTFLLCASALLATGCDNLFFLEAETDEVCKTQRGDVVPGAPLAIEGSIEQSIDFPVGAFGETALPDDAVDLVLRAKLFSVTATDPTIDLSGIQEATVSARRIGEAGQGTLLLSYTRTADSPASNRFVLTGDEEVELLEFNRGEDLELVFRATGTLPSRSWTPELRGCAGLQARGDYSDLIF